MSTIAEATPQLIASATLHVETSGGGFVDITENAVSFIAEAAAGDSVGIFDSDGEPARDQAHITNIGAAAERFQKAGCGERRRCNHR